MEFGAKKQKQKSAPETKSRSNLNPISRPSADSFFVGASLAYCFAFSFRRKLRTGVRALASIRGGLIGSWQKKAYFQHFLLYKRSKICYENNRRFFGTFWRTGPNRAPLAASGSQAKATAWPSGHARSTRRSGFVRVKPYFLEKLG